MKLLISNVIDYAGLFYYKHLEMLAKIEPEKQKYTFMEHQYSFSFSKREQEPSRAKE